MSVKNKGSLRLSLTDRMYFKDDAESQITVTDFLMPEPVIFEISGSNAVFLEGAIVSLKRRTAAWQRTHQDSHPPQIGEYFLYLLLPKKDRDSAVGDLIEEYRTRILPKFGPRKAWFWFWTQVIFSIGPIVWARLKKIATLAGLAKAVQEILHRLAF